MDFWDVFWTLVIWIPLILLWGFALVDLFASSHPGLAKALWAIAIIFLPIIGVILYFALRPSHEETYNVASARQVGPSDSDDIARLADMNERGILGDADFARIVTTMYR